MLFNWAVRVIRGFEAHTDCCNRGRSPPQRRTITGQKQEQLLFTKTLESQRASLRMTPKKMTDPSDLLMSVKVLSTEEQNMLKEAVLEAPAPRKTVQRKSIEEFESQLRRAIQILDSIQLIAPWIQVYVQDDYVIYMYQPQINELEPRNQIEFYGHFTLPGDVPTVIDTIFHNLDKLEENLGTKITTDEYAQDGTSTAKNYLQYNATLMTPEQDAFIEMIADKNQGLLMMKSVEDQRYPQKDGVERLHFNLKSFKAQRISELPQGLNDTGNSILVTFYMEIKSEDVLSYETIQEEIAQNQEAWVNNLRQCLQ